MVCKTAWAIDAVFFSTTMGLSPERVNGATRCKNPLCRRPLQKDGTCVRGCPQDSAVPRLPELDALVCLFEEMGAGGDARWEQDPRLLAARAATQNGGKGERALRSALGGLLDVADFLFIDGESVEGDPRVRAARTYVRREALQAWETLRNSWETFRAALAADPEDGLPPGGYTELNVELARERGVPLWHQAWEVWQSQGTVLSQQEGADAWTNAPEEIAAIQEAVVTLLRTLPPERLAEALTGMNLERADVDLLQLPSVRDVVLQPRPPLRNSRALAGMNALEELPSLGLCIRDGERAYRGLQTVGLSGDQRKAGLGVGHLAAVVDAGWRLGQIAELGQGRAAEMGYDLDEWMRVVNAAVGERLGQTEMTGSCPAPLVAVANLHSQAWREIGGHPEWFAMPLLQRVAEQGGLEVAYARNAERGEIVQWLEAATYRPKQTGVRVVMARRFAGQSWESFWSPDATGRVWKYAPGQQVQLPASAGGQQGLVEACEFLGEQGPDGAVWEARPMVGVRVEGELRKVPATEVTPL